MVANERMKEKNAMLFTHIPRPPDFPDDCLAIESPANQDVCTVCVLIGDCLKSSVGEEAFSSM